MRSQHSGRTGSPSSGWVLVPVATRTRRKLTFVMVPAVTVALASRRRLRSRLGGKDMAGGVSSRPRLMSGQDATDLLTQECRAGLQD